VPVSSYDAIAALYDPWSRSVTEDVDFYVAQARKAGVHVIGVDDSEGMLALCRARAEEAGVSGLLELRLGDLRRPPVQETVRLVMCPFRALLHLGSDEERLEALRAVYRLLEPGGRLVFDVFAPSMEDVEETNGRWIEREPGIWERADWDLARRVLTLAVRGESGETAMDLAWRSPEEWLALLERARFEVEAMYGWFDLRPYNGGEDTVWIARRPAV